MFKKKEETVTVKDENKLKNKRSKIYYTIKISLDCSYICIGG